MKKILFILITSISILFGIKVKAIATIPTDSTNLNVYWLSRTKNAMEWVYNTSNDYLLSLKENYTSYTYYFTTGTKNSSRQQYYINIKIFLYDDEAFIENTYQSNALGFKGLRVQAPVTEYIRFQFCWDALNNVAYTDDTFTEVLSEVTSSQIIFQTSNTSVTDYINLALFGNANTSLENYGMYFSNMKIANISGARSISLMKLIDNDTNLWDVDYQSLIGQVPPHYIQTMNRPPNYLTGYKPVEITPENRNTMLSGLTSGSVFIPYDAYQLQHGTLGYFDVDVKYQPYTSIIENVYLMPDNLYYKQDFDLTTHPEAEYMAFYKYLYYEGEDTLTYTIYVPDEMYDSTIVGTIDEVNGKYDYTYEYKDENGDIQEGCFSGQESEFLKGSPLINDIFGSFSSDTFGLSSIITAPLYLINQLSSATCEPLVLPFPYTNNELSLPCMSSIYTEHFGELFELYQFLLLGFTSYRVGVSLFRDIKQLKDPDNDEIEVIDL